jgi:hypothetical protein
VGKEFLIARTEIIEALFAIRRCEKPVFWKNPHLGGYAAKKQIPIINRVSSGTKKPGLGIRALQNWKSNRLFLLLLWKRGKEFSGVQFTVAIGVGLGECIRRLLAGVFFIEFLIILLGSFLAVGDFQHDKLLFGEGLVTITVGIGELFFLLFSG